jgi:hypothetical protein
MTHHAVADGAGHEQSVRRRSANQTGPDNRDAGDRGWNGVKPKMFPWRSFCRTTISRTCPFH